MTVVLAMTKRNVKLFFKDKGMFFTALITPAILLVLYATFLGKVYRDSFLSSLPVGFVLSDDVIGGLVGGMVLIFKIIGITWELVSIIAGYFWTKSLKVE